MNARVLRHFKGGLYVICNCVTDTATGEAMLIYKSLDTGKEYARPEKEFYDFVDDREDNVTGQTLRFEPVEICPIADKLEDISDIALVEELKRRGNNVLVYHDKDKFQERYLAGIQRSYAFEVLYVSDTFEGIRNQVNLSRDLPIKILKEVTVDVGDNYDPKVY